MRGLMWWGLKTNGDSWDTVYSTHVDVQTTISLKPSRHLQNVEMAYSEKTLQYPCVNLQLNKTSNWSSNINPSWTPLMSSYGGWCRSIASTSSEPVQKWKTAGQASTKFWKHFGIIVQVFNEAIYEGALVYCNGPWADSSRPLVDSRHLI